MSIDDLARWEITKRQKERKHLLYDRVEEDEQLLPTHNAEIITYYIDKNGRRIDETKTDENTEEQPPTPAGRL